MVLALYGQRCLGVFEKRLSATSIYRLMLQLLTIDEWRWNNVRNQPCKYRRQFSSSSLGLRSKVSESGRKGASSPMNVVQFKTRQRQAKKEKLWLWRGEVGGRQRSKTSRWTWLNCVWVCMCEGHHGWYNLLPTFGRNLNRLCIPMQMERIVSKVHFFKNLRSIDLRVFVRM